jgi:transposase
MIHRFNDQGMASLDPQWAGGRPRRITTDDEAFVVKTARQRPETLGRPFTRWSIRKLVGYLADNDQRIVEHRPGTAPSDPGCPQHHVPAAQNLEGIERS